MYFLVDFENVGNIGLRGVDYLARRDFMTLFFSRDAHCCERRYLDAVERSGCRFDSCKLQNKGKNGLDFYIASRLGEFYGEGHRDRAAIISRDKGYKAVRDYWNVRLPSDKKIILSPSVERGILAANDNSERMKTLSKKLSGMDIDVF